MKRGQDLYNLFRIESNNGRRWLITNLGLASLEGDDADEATMRVHRNSSPFAPLRQCWAFIGFECKRGDLVIGELSHHPYDSQDHLPVLYVEKKIKNECASRSR